jgi:NAD(P)-dependent dehydrogenase (short-subunit alcohol dehydrogenase family)
MTPMKRPQTLADVAKAVVSLASPDAANMTGQCLHVDGGAVIRD